MVTIEIWWRWQRIIIMISNKRKNIVATTINKRTKTKKNFAAKSIKKCDVMVLHACSKYALTKMRRNCKKNRKRLIESISELKVVYLSKDRIKYHSIQMFQVWASHACCGWSSKNGTGTDGTSTMRYCWERLCCRSDTFWEASCKSHTGMTPDLPGSDVSNSYKFYLM